MEQNEFNKKLAEIKKECEDLRIEFFKDHDGPAILVDNADTMINKMKKLDIVIAVLNLE